MDACVHAFSSFIFDKICILCLSIKTSKIEKRTEKETEHQLKMFKKV